MYKKFLKRIIDFITSLLALIVLSPIIIILILFLSFKNHGNPFYFQDRSGLNAQIFKIVKFKTMNNKRDARGKLLPDNERLTRFGLLLRSFSLDELPQLINVLKGDMSLIGPRPLLVDYLTLYNEYQLRRHDVRPGITGWAQVNGRNNISWEEKFELDIWYVDNLSLLLDFKILFLTFHKVIKRENINSSNTATMEKFGEA